MTLAQTYPILTVIVGVLFTILMMILFKALNEHNRAANEEQLRVLKDTAKLLKAIEARSNDMTKDQHYSAAVRLDNFQYNFQSSVKEKQSTEGLNSIW